MQSIVPDVQPPDAMGDARIGFELAGFPPSDPFGIVVIALSPGLFPLSPLGDPRVLGLAVDGLFTVSSSQALWLTSLSGGDGVAPTLVTGAVGSGFAFHAAGFSFDLATGIAIGELSDTVPVTIP